MTSLSEGDNNETPIKVLMFLMIVLMLAGCSFTTANYKNLKMASEIDVESSTPVTVTSSFASSTPSIYVTGEIDNAPEGTMMKIEWIYLETTPETFILDYEMEAGDVSHNFYFQLSKPTAGWPPGEYEARLYIDDTLEEVLPFVIE